MGQFLQGKKSGLASDPVITYFREKAHTLDQCNIEMMLTGPAAAVQEFPKQSGQVGTRVEIAENWWREPG